jgi:hypothetical protein
MRAISCRCVLASFAARERRARADVTPGHRVFTRTDIQPNLRLRVHRCEPQPRSVEALPGARSTSTAWATHIDYRSESGFERSLVAQNRFHRRHAEQNGAFLANTAEVPRSIYAKLLQRF